MRQTRLALRAARGSLLPIAVAAFAGLASGCRSTTDIGKLLDDPARYDGRTVRVEGEVSSSVGALGRGAYLISDDTGTLPVVSTEMGTPRSGARVGVEGVFRSVFTLGTESLAVLEEKRRFD